MPLWNFVQMLPILPMLAGMTCAPEIALDQKQAQPVLLNLPRVSKNLSKSVAVALAARSTRKAATERNTINFRVFSEPANAFGLSSN